MNNQHDIVDLFKSMSPAQRNSMSEICTLLKLTQVVPATNAESERSASALRRVKSYLRSTMSQSRLNNLMLLHVHKHRTDNLDLKICSNEFITGNDHRKQNHSLTLLMVTFVVSNINHSDNLNHQ